MSDVVLNLGADVAQEKTFVQKWTDPNILPQPYTQPADFAAQYPNPLDTTELLRLCEEVSLWNWMPEERTQLSTYTWREMTSLAYSSGSSYIGFADGACPEAYTHDGANKHVDIKNIGVKKTLSIRDIMHSQAVAGAGGIGALIGAAPSSEGMPGGYDASTFARQAVANVKEKEVRLGATLLMNGWDRLLVAGDTNTNALEFDGIEQWATNMSCTLHTNDNSASGTFSAISFDRFLSESCAKPTVLMGPPAAIQELMSAYFQLGYQGASLINYNDGSRIVPGYNFASFVNTGAGRMEVVADNNFTRVNLGGGLFSASIWAFRATHNGEPMIYKITQIPLGITDLVPGCTAISFQIWCATALVIKACCFHGRYDSVFSGRTVNTCTVIG